MLIPAADNLRDINLLVGNENFSTESSIGQLMKLKVHLFMECRSPEVFRAFHRTAHCPMH